ncbi:MAG: hypothetical protein H0Z24_05470 [Thermosipho sp. (in: Bacteria)]|nr:hypothetical protein [Thermosipho sp. (in: thermotogales)]
MIRDLSKVQDLVKNFYNSRAEIQKMQNDKQKEFKVGWENVRKREKTRTKTSFYDKYKAKLENGNIDKFSTRDFMYFFRDTANSVGIKYVIANIKKDMRVYKLLKERGYTNEEIYNMIRFLFLSEQDYLDKKTLQPTILLSGWCNKIYQDSQDWVNNEYVPTKKKKFSQREWNKEVNNNDYEVSIGEWDF